MKGGRFGNVSIVVAGLALLLALVAASVWLGYRDSNAALRQPLPTTAARARFESNPLLWTATVKDFSAFLGDLNQHLVTEVGVEARASSPTLLLVSTRSGEHYMTEPIGAAGDLDARLNDAARDDGFVLTRVFADLRNPLQRTLDALSLAAEYFARVIAIVSLLALAVFALLLLQKRGKKGLLMTTPTTRFADVVGVEEAKLAMSEVVAFIKNPAKYAELGAKPPRGILLDAPPGTGKTLLARALAGEAQANFIAIDGSYFSSMFYEQGVKRVESLFATARENAPCVIFIDEIDGIGVRSSSQSQRGAGQGEENRIINKLLVELDGFEASENVVVIGATNHRDNIDPALLRSGRFDQVVKLSLPNIREREKIFELYVGQIKAEPGIDRVSLARATAGMSPADIALLVNRAAVLAAEAQADLVTDAHLRTAIENMQLGGRVSSVKSLMDEAERRRIAEHELGHAFVGHFAQAGQVIRVSIEPRGQALGVTYMSRDNETPLYGEAELRGQLAMKLGGREAELLFYENTTSGGADDLKRASDLAYRMVTELGFSKEFGVLSLAGLPPEAVGSETREKSMAEARRLLDDARAQARAILVAHRGAVEAARDALLAKEVLTAEEFLAFVGQEGEAPKLRVA